MGLIQNRGQLMLPDHENQQTANFNARFFPQQVLLLTTGKNMMPMGYWTVISKNPFRFLVCMGVGNHSLTLLRKNKEAALHFMPWEDRERVVKAGYISGSRGDKAAQLEYSLVPARVLETTHLIEGADCIYETVVKEEIPNLSTEFVLFVLDVVATHGSTNPADRSPIFYLSDKDFATIGEQWKYRQWAWE
jgi:flavin reductase (DIM6/NTAB) family NADH-FMN oxidoreductase RutF